eukprot:scaffold13227_cov117-Isochrysis_galbana.AAC.16
MVTAALRAPCSARRAPRPRKTAATIVAPALWRSDVRERASQARPARLLSTRTRACSARRLRLRLALTRR